jgi:hypothetical protein
MDTIFIVKLIEDSITSNYNEVKIVLYFKCCYIRFSHYNLRIALILLKFSFNVSKGTTYRKPTWKYSIRAINNLLLAFENRVRDWNHT